MPSKYQNVSKRWKESGVQTALRGLLGGSSVGVGSE